MHTFALKVWFCNKQILRSQCATAQPASNWWFIAYQMMRTGYAVTILAGGRAVDTAFRSVALTGLTLTTEAHVGSQYSVTVHLLPYNRMNNEMNRLLRLVKKNGASKLIRTIIVSGWLELLIYLQEVVRSNLRPKVVYCG